MSADHDKVSLGGSFRRNPLLTIVGPHDNAEMVAFTRHNTTCPHCSTRNDVLDLCREGSRLMREMFASDDEVSP